MAIINQAIYRRKSGEPIPVGLVLTPGGYRHPSFVHHVAFGQRVRRRKQELQIVHSRSQRIVARHSIASQHLPDITPGLGSGWATSAYWPNPTGSTISQIVTKWAVPPAPAAGSVGQIIYLFNGLQNAARTNLLQPVLQWGATEYGGGPYWSISNWYIDSSGSGIYSDYREVPPGQNLTGFVSLGQESGGRCSYIVGFEEYPDLNLPTSGVDPSPVAVEVLEAYNIGHCAEYPAEPFTSMSSIFIAADGATPLIDWNFTGPGGCNEQTTITSPANPGGCLEIHY